MKKDIVATESYAIDGFKHFSSLAWEYFQEHTTASAAAKYMRTKIEEHDALSKELEATGYVRHTINLSPEMQMVIYRHWGPPTIKLTITAPTTRPENDE